MSKFKVGDKIIGNKKASKNYSVTRKGWEGEIVECKGWEGEIVEIEPGYFTAEDEYGHEYGGLREDCFDLARDLREKVL